MKRILSVACAVLLSASAAAAEHGAKMLDDAWVRAVTANDIEAIVALYAPDAVLYPPGQVEAKGKDAIRAVWGGMLDAYTVKEARMFDTRYETSGNLSTGWGRASMTMIPKSGGEPITMEVRFHDVAMRKGKKWLYISDHASVPLPPPPK